MKQFLIIICVLSTFALQLDARIDRYDEKGLKVAKKSCKSCHGNSYKVASMKKASGWKKFFKDDGKAFVKVHQGLAETEEIIALSKRKSKFKHLQKFLTQSASDSGVVSTCDGNFCGR